MTVETTPPGGTETTVNASADKTTVATATTPPTVPVVVLETKKKRKHSRGLRDVHETHRGMTKAHRRLSKAVSKGFDEYLRRSDKSAEKKKDGALRDFMVNASRAMSMTIRKSSDAPVDIAKAINTKRMQKRMRRVAKALAPPWSR